VLSLEPGGSISVMIDISASQGHIVPTSSAERDGFFFVGNLNLFPIDPQWARVQTIATGFQGNQDFAPGFAADYHGYHVIDSKAGFTTVVAVDFGPDGLLYVLELSDAPGFPALGVGKVLRVRPSGVIEEVVTGLSVPTGMTFGPDGQLYVSNFGAAPAGAGAIGQVLRFAITPGE
jgi:sugar lactone lactonase YvrE